MSYVIITRCGELYSRRLFDTIKQARAYNSVYTIRLATWKERESITFDYYPRLPWDLATIPYHYAYRDGDKISFCDEKGRRTLIKPGRYLNRFYKDLTPQQVENYAVWFQKGARPAGLQPGTVWFAVTPDEIEQVYDEGPRSCMRGCSQVRVYGAGDLAVAFFTDEEGEITARTLCWPAKKIYGECRYGDDYEELEARLIAEGFREALERDWNGAKLLKISQYRGWLMPYLDYFDISDGGEHFIATNCGTPHKYEDEPFDAEEEEEELPICDHCGLFVPQRYETEGPFVVRTPIQELWCASCTHDDATHTANGYVSTEYANQNNMVAA